MIVGEAKYEVVARRLLVCLEVGIGGILAVAVDKCLHLGRNGGIERTEVFC